MAILQLVEHLGAYVEEFDAIGLGVNHRTIFVMDRLPVELLLIEIAILAVYDTPEGFEIAHRVVVKLHIVTTRAEARTTQYDYPQIY